MLNAHDDNHTVNAGEKEEEKRERNDTLTISSFSSPSAGLIRQWLTWFVDGKYTQPALTTKNMYRV